MHEVNTHMQANICISCHRIVERIMLNSTTRTLEVTRSHQSQVIESHDIIAETDIYMASTEEFIFVMEEEVEIEMRPLAM